MGSCLTVRAGQTRAANTLTIRPRPAAIPVCLNRYNRPLADPQARFDPRLRSRPASPSWPILFPSGAPLDGRPPALCQRLHRGRKYCLEGVQGRILSSARPVSSPTTATSTKRSPPPQRILETLLVKNKPVVLTCHAIRKRVP